MKSISCLTSICLATAALAITAACHPAAARSNSDQPSAVSSNQLLLAGRGSRPAQVEQAPEEQHRSVGRGGGWKAAPSDDSNHRSVGRGGSSASSHSSGHSWGRGGASRSSRHRHRSVGRGGGWVNAEPPRRNVWGVFDQDNERHEHHRESDRNVFGIFGR
jgi:hypothetical protein